MEDYVRATYHGLQALEADMRRDKDERAKRDAAVDKRLAQHDLADEQSRIFQATVRGIFIGVAAIVVPTVTAILAGVGVWIVTG